MMSNGEFLCIKVSELFQYLISILRSGWFNQLKNLFINKGDIMDGLNTETLAATLFMYFATLSTA